MDNAVDYAFAGSGLERAAELRASPDRLAALLAAPGARVLPLWRGRPLMAGAALRWLDPGHAVLRTAAAPIFLGTEAGQAWFAQDISDWQPEAEQPQAPNPFDAGDQTHPLLPEPQVFAELRNRMAQLSARDGELAAMARALTEWHRSHGFCSRCGAASQPSHGGWQRTCPACGAEHFPRTDPVVIMLVVAGNAVLLGRGAGWPERAFSCLAGFVEPGETVEAAVRREVAEETGVRVGQVRYVASQPWPFPASLMIGCRAEALSRDLAPDPAEIAEARWVTREDLLEVIAGTHAQIRAPSTGAIAAALLRGWLADCC